MAIFLNDSIIDLNLACKIKTGCQAPSGSYRIDNGCLVDSVSGNDGGIAGHIYIHAASFGLPAINSVGVAISEPLHSGTIFKLDSCDAFADCTTGIQEFSAIEKNIYPNPFQHNLMIKNDSNFPFEIILYDLTSRIIFHQTFSTSISIDTEPFAKGIFIYELRNKNVAIKKGKIIKD